MSTDDLQEAQEALWAVAEAFTRWSEDASDGTYALYRADDRLTYWKDDDLMAACLAARQYFQRRTREKNLRRHVTWIDEAN